MIPDEAYAEAAWKVMKDFHDDWDALHHFLPMRWDEEESRLVIADTIVALDPAIHPTQYGVLMLGILQKLDATVDACALQIEAFGVTEPKEFESEEEKARFQYERENRLFHTRPDARECAMVLVASTDGRLWQVEKFRDKPDQSDWRETHRVEGDVGGQLADSLIKVTALYSREAKIRMSN